MDSRSSSSCFGPATLLHSRSEGSLLNIRYPNPSLPPTQPSVGNMVGRLPSQNSSKPYAHMVCERWLHARLDNLRTKNIMDQRTEYDNLPQKVEKKFVDFNVREKNIRGETLIMSVIRYELDKANQVRYINLLIRAGCDPSEPDERRFRTPLMLACLMRNDPIAHHLILQNVDLTAADKMGNTALMYAAMYSQSSLLNFLSDELTRRWCIEAFRATNLMGYTAESLARKNERYMFSLMLKKGRLRLLKRLREHVTINLMYAPPFNSWNTYVAIYKAKQKFMLYIQRNAYIPQNSTLSPVKYLKPSLPLLHGINGKFSTKNLQQKLNSPLSSTTDLCTNLPRLAQSVTNLSPSSSSGE